MNNLNWFRSAMVSTLPCHGRDCGFESRRNRHDYAELVELADTPDLESGAFSVQVQFCIPHHDASVAQLDRVPDFESGG